MRATSPSSRRISASGCVQATLLLATFINVLWSLSNSFVFHVAGRAIPIPGYMVWAAVVYSGSASLLSYWVGKSLIGRNADRYAREADLRFSLVRVNEHIDSIALAGGEPDETRRIELDLQSVLKAMRLLVTGTTNLTWVTAGYGWFTLVAPILVAAPLYFAGELTFGGLMMASGAFMQVQSSLRWFVDNFSTLADWRATLLRVASFRRALLACDDMHEVASRIEYAEGEPGRIVIDGLGYLLAGGLRPPRRIARGGKIRRTRPGDRRERERTDPALPGPRRSLAMGQGTHRPAWGRDDALPAAYLVPASRHVARSSCLPLRRRRVRLRRLRQGSGAPRSRSGSRPCSTNHDAGKPC